MYNYIMLDELFKPYGCTITRFGSGTASIISYRIKCILIGLDQSFSWDASGKLENFLIPHMEKFMTVVTNGTQLNPNVIYDKEKLLELIDSSYIRLTPDLKLSNVLEYLSRHSVYDGQIVDVPVPKLIQAVQLYYTNVREWKFYLDSAVLQGYVQKVKQPIDEARPYAPLKYSYNLTVDGLARLIKANEGKSSNNCFVAMAFVNDMFTIFDSSIQPALIKCGFKAYMVSKVHVDSDKTINDAILSGIKKSKFTIADFTYHRAGVYFEAGYALGRGQKVIYTCKDDHMANAHFDLRNNQHIVWTDAEDFRLKLIDKIEAFIND